MGLLQTLDEVVRFVLGFRLEQAKTCRGGLPVMREKSVLGLWEARLERKDVERPCADPTALDGRRSKLREN